jgi:L-alanine-DL-glutamate epimerase-like enolase superfamily enzyme
MRTFDVIGELPLSVEGYALDGLTADVSSGFTRRTTVVRVFGGGEEGVGEDVTYAGDEQIAFQDAGPAHDLTGRHTLESFSALVGSLDLFPDGEPKAPAWRHYRRWAFESAALDLALRQAGLSLAEALGRTPASVRFVVSKRLPEPPSVEPLRRLLTLYPGTRLKLDPTTDWTPDVVAELAALDAVETVDLKAAYRGTPVDQPTSPELYRLVAESFPKAIIEDPDLVDPAAEAVLRPHLDRVSWDAVIHSVADIQALPFPPRVLNIKPSRFGSVSTLFDAYDHCAQHRVMLYGGGQFELGPGRGQIQYLASLFHPDGPNDVAPPGYNDPEPGPGLPTSPLEPSLEPVGFRLR